ncbi:MAG: DUF5667 domain-containing protein, partial [Chloroflexota bacterium]|nr:DUF5667 domain-containing protein [Chloroflexota bacterium]
QPKPRRFSFFEWQRRWTIAVAAVLFVVLIGGSSAVAASVNAMPDEILYPVKLAAERVQLTFTPSDVNKAELEAKFANRRVQEIAEMAEESKWEKVEAAAERLSNHLEKIGEVAAEKRAAGTVTEQDVSKLRGLLAYYATDHPLIFEKALQKTPIESKVAIRDVLDTSKNYYANAIQDVNIAVRSNTSQQLAANAETKSISGIIRMITNGKWIIGEEVVNTNTNTSIDGAPKIGAAVKIETQIQPDGALLARTITVREAALSTSNVVSIEENSVSIEATITATKTPSAEVAPKPTPNISDTTETPSVTATQQPSQLTQQIDIRAFNGTIRKITDRAWSIGYRTVIVYDKTVINGEPKLGKLARVWVTVQPNGMLVAHKIWVQADDITVVPETTVIDESRLSVEAVEKSSSAETNEDTSKNSTNVLAGE